LTKQKFHFNKSTSKWCAFFVKLQISNEYLLILSILPGHHSDPFDRLIVSQAIDENLTLISKDKGLKKYKIMQQWA